MGSGLEGRCLCGKVGYDTGGDLLWVTICYCRFCQRATGSDRMIEPVFERSSFAFTGGSTAVFTLLSEGSGKDIHVHFCPDCGTKLALTFERWPDRIGIYAGTLNERSSVSITPENSRHIFVSEARPGTILPAGYKTYDGHAASSDGIPLKPTVHALPFLVGG
jgi:hypothetical protein